jgi:GT2 family glycosyltransferase
VISIITLIYRSTRYADAVYASLHRHTPQLRDGGAEFFFVANGATNGVLKHLQARGYPHIVNEVDELTEPDLFALGIGPTVAVHRGYIGWNAGIRAARGDRIVLVGSDMLMSPGWLDGLLECDDGKTAPTSFLVEPGHKCGPFPGMDRIDLGRHPDAVDEPVWLATAASVRRPGERRAGGAFQPGILRRSWLDEVGLFPDGNLAGDSLGTVREYGDRDLYKRLASIGVEHVTAMGSVVYHIGEGEMDER